MEDTSKVYRIRTKVGDNAPKVIHVPLNQTYDMFEILSLKINQSNSYKTYESDYGVVVGRVQANGGVGVPNAKVSIFIEVSEDDSLKDKLLYNFTSVNSTDNNGVRYNLLPDYIDDACHQDVGTFPNKRLVLDNQDIIEMFDKYWKYTTTTNKSGDYMIFGVPTGSQTLHCDLDLSDCGFLSQRPRNMMAKGYNATMFESPNKFKYSTNLNSLAQIISQDKGIYVYPYWGDTSDGDDNFAITRCDINLEYKFEPSAVFIGCIVTDKASNAIGKNCASTDQNGRMSDLIAGEGTIEMIRKTLDNKVEAYPIMGNRLIDGDGTWAYDIPMNLDYVTTDEYGNLIPTDNPAKGIPTRARVRFRISLDDDPEDASARKRARYLVPNNPRIGDKEFNETLTPDYEFGSATREESYCDLFWNKVYTVKNYIPRLQKNGSVKSRTHSGIKLVNHHGDNNPMPYNALTIKLSFTYRLICVIAKIFIKLVGFVNSLIVAIDYLPCQITRIPLIGSIFKPITNLLPNCIPISSEFCDDGINPNVYYPNCKNCAWKRTRKDCQAEQKDKDKEDKKKCTNKKGELENCIENELAQEFEATSFNFYNDWVNGVLYAPLWYRKVTPKKSFFFGLFKKKAKDEWCSTNRHFDDLRIMQTCAVERKTDFKYDYENFDDKKIVPYHMTSGVGCEKKKNCQKSTSSVNGLNGVIQPKETMLGQTVYYYAPGEYDKSLKSNVYLDGSTKPSQGEVKLLFATDIVLLGSLNECDINGIPQFFRTLESTTYKLPTNILFTDHIFQNVLDEKGNFVETTYTEVSEMAGCDWGNKNEYGKNDGGLFYSIGCSEINLTPKSCINLIRLCEYGVSLDETKQVPNMNNLESDGDNAFENLVTDGFVSWDELYNLNERSMFATMNGNRLKTKLNNRNGLREYDFRYLYPENFDGSLKDIMRETTKKYDSEVTYRNNYKLEQFSRDYYVFRMGNAPYYYDSDNKGKYAFPRYENSFYFYFGLKAGKTAIEKFNSKYFAECNNAESIETQIDIKSRANTWCSQIGQNTNDGYVAFDFKSIETPYDLLINSRSEGDKSWYFPNLEEEKIILYFNKDVLNATEEKKFKEYTGKELKDPDHEGMDNMLDNGEYIGVLTDNSGNITEFTFELRSEYLTFKKDVQDFTQPNNVLYPARDYVSIAKDAVGKKIDCDTKQVTRQIGGVITIYDILYKEEEIENYRIRLEPKNIIKGYEGVEFTKESTILPMGVHKYTNCNGAIVYGIGVPKGDEIYKVTITQLCGEDDSQNLVTMSISVKDPLQYKMYINDIDYDLIKNFNKIGDKYSDGWIPKDKIDKKKAELQDSRDGRVIFQGNPWFNIDKVWKITEFENIESIKQLDEDVINPETLPDQYIGDKIKLEAEAYVPITFVAKGDVPTTNEGDYIQVGNDYYVWDSEDNVYSLIDVIEKGETPEENVGTYVVVKPNNHLYMWQENEDEYIRKEYSVKTEVPVENEGEYIKVSDVYYKWGEETYYYKWNDNQYNSITFTVEESVPDTKIGDGNESIVYIEVNGDYYEWGAKTHYYVLVENVYQEIVEEETIPDFKIEGADYIKVDEAYYKWDSASNQYSIITDINFVEVVEKSSVPEDHEVNEDFISVNGTLYKWEWDVIGEYGEYVSVDNVGNYYKISKEEYFSIKVIEKEEVPTTNEGDYIKVTKIQYVSIDVVEREETPDENVADYIKVNDRYYKWDKVYICYEWGTNGYTEVECSSDSVSKIEGFIRQIKSGNYKFRSETDESVEVTLNEILFDFTNKTFTVNIEKIDDNVVMGNKLYVWNNTSNKYEQKTAKQEDSVPEQNDGDYIALNGLYQWNDFYEWDGNSSQYVLQSVVDLETFSTQINYGTFVKCNGTYYKRNGNSYEEIDVISKETLPEYIKVNNYYYKLDAVNGIYVQITVSSKTEVPTQNEGEYIKVGDEYYKWNTDDEAYSPITVSESDPYIKVDKGGGYVMVSYTSLDHGPTTYEGVYKKYSSGADYYYRWNGYEYLGITVAQKEEFPQSCVRDFIIYKTYYKWNNSEYEKIDVTTLQTVYYTWTDDYLLEYPQFMSPQYSESADVLLSQINLFIDNINNVMMLRNELPSMMQDTFYLSCNDEQKFIDVSVQTSDMPGVATIVYQEEVASNTGNENALNTDKMVITYEGSVDNVTIPTITYAGSKEYGRTSDRYYPIVAQYINGKKKYNRHAFYVGVMNDAQKSIPSGMVSKKNNDVWIIDEKKNNLNLLFDFPIIDKKVKIDYVCWAYIEDIPYFNNVENERLNKGSVTMDGIFAGKVFNGKKNSDNEFDTQTLCNFKLKLTDNLITEETYVEECLVRGYNNDYVENRIIDVLTDYIQNVPTVIIGSAASDLNIMLYQVSYFKAGDEKTDVIEFLSGLTIENGYLIYDGTKSASEIWPDTREWSNVKIDDIFFSQYINYTEYVVDNSITETYPIQYAPIMPVQTELRLEDSNGCGINETIYSQMRIELEDESVNDCKTGKKVLEVIAENVDNSEIANNLVYYSVIKIDDDEGYKYPLNYVVQGRSSVAKINERISGIYRKEQYGDSRGPWNIFSYAMNSLYFRNAEYTIVDKGFKSQIIEIQSDGEPKVKESKGYGNTGHFETDHTHPVYVVAETSNHCRTLSPVYDFSTVTANFGVGILDNNNDYVVFTSINDEDTEQFYVKNYSYTLSGTFKYNDSTIFKFGDEEGIIMHSTGKYAYLDINAFTVVGQRPEEVAGNILTWIGHEDDSQSVYPKIKDRAEIVVYDYIGLKNICNFKLFENYLNFYSFEWNAEIPEDNATEIGINKDEAFYNYVKDIYKDGASSADIEIYKVIGNDVYEWMGWSQDATSLTDKYILIEHSGEHGDFYKWTEFYAYYVWYNNHDYIKIDIAKKETKPEQYDGSDYIRVNDRYYKWDGNEYVEITFETGIGMPSSREANYAIKVGNSYYRWNNDTNSYSVMNVKNIPETGKIPDEREEGYDAIKFENILYVWSRYDGYVDIVVIERSEIPSNKVSGEYIKIKENLYIKLKGKEEEQIPTKKIDDYDYIYIHNGNYLYYEWDDNSSRYDEVPITKYSSKYIIEEWDSIIGNDGVKRPYDFYGKWAIKTLNAE